MTPRLASTATGSHHRMGSARDAATARTASVPMDDAGSTKPKPAPRGPVAAGRASCEPEKTRVRIAKMLSGLESDFSWELSTGHEGLRARTHEPCFCWLMACRSAS